MLKLTVSYIRIDESVWHPNIEPKCFRIKFAKKLRTAEKFIFWIMQFEALSRGCILSELEMISFPPIAVVSP